MSLTANNKYSRCSLHTLTQIQNPLSLKQKNFRKFLLQFLNVHEILNILNIKLSILA